MNTRIALLDLGTNTFHLMIIEVKEDGATSLLFKTEQFVKLAEDGIDKIGDKAFGRALKLLKEYKTIIDEHQPEKVIAFGTAALRNASNAGDFIQQVSEETGIEIKRISGDEEAALIYGGVRQAVTLGHDPALIMDIGGGSTEFIIANNDKIFWKQSFPLGVTVLKQRFHHTEPIVENEKHKLVSYLQKELHPLFEQLDKYAIHHLIGASGSFDSYTSMIAHKHYSPDVLKGKTSFDMKREEVISVIAELQKLTLEQRLQMPGLLAFRAEMITVAAILTEVILKRAAIYRVTQSAYALKEGMMAQISGA